MYEWVFILAEVVALLEAFVVSDILGLRPEVLRRDVACRPDVYVFAILLSRVGIQAIAIAAEKTEHTSCLGKSLKLKNQFNIIIILTKPAFYLLPLSS